MKKVLIALVVLLFAASVYADSRLDLSGQMRVRGKTFENFSDFDDSNSSDEQSYFDQRFRIGGKINVAEGISANFRLDFMEETWGEYDTHSDPDVIDQDRGYLEIDKDMFMLRAGRQYFGLGNSIAVDTNGNGFLLKLKTPLEVTALYQKASEGGAKSDESSLLTEDQTVYGLNLGYSAEMVNGNVFYTTAISGDNADTPKGADKSVIGLQADGKAGMVAFNAEYNYFTGSDDNSSIDFVGSQLYLDGSANVGMAKVGAELFYAAGTDANDEEQITYINNWDSFTPVGGFADSDIVDVALPGNNSVFELASNSGSIGIAPYVSVSPMEKLSLAANVGYFEPQEDSVTDLNSLTVATLTANYKLYDNTGLKVQYGYASPDADTSGSVGDYPTDDAAQGFYGKLYVNF
ncbi:hypothetical protein Flexsi_0345 [Flexistipes sinusarabici DSM 4947]|uniref:Uncharacterized protein n=1 Tax=Flexistipes sinusarabici (strain ATCC 49648 / DSM 4947 / MAS 10) TaxID=717231 RepID=F8E8I6_FLESM|nr:porin [Flexistipes sinusarabici]AEI14035.1 hypothetical protein Flexsi_0345 [Flexistipes sinusarabici DSM 4947]